MREGNILWLLVSEARNNHVSDHHYWTTKTNLLTDSKAMKPKGNVIIVPNVLFQKYLIDKDPQSNLRIY